MLGSVCTIIPNKTACLRCIFPALAEDDMPTCSTEGVHPSILYLVGGIQVSEAVKIILGEKPTLENKLMYVDLNDLSLEKISVFRQEECPSCGTKRIESNQLETKQLIIEELCGRDRGKRTYTVTPSHISSSLNLIGIEKNAERLGYTIKTKGELGLTIMSSNSDSLSISFMSSGAATIVGAKSEDEALSIYTRFVDDIKS
jgi:adenylyltransferase/sulfurtransferase